MGRRVALDAIDTQLRRRRVAAGVSQHELAIRSGLTRQAISAIEAGHYVPNTAVALRLARALACTVEDIFQVPETRPRLTAELVATDGPVSSWGEASRETPLVDADAPIRVALARVGARVLARPLSGAAGAQTAADGLATPAPAAPSVDVDLLVDPWVIERTVVVLGCDPALALLGAHLARRYPALRLIWAQSGSLAALRALARGEGHAAGSHLRDPDTGEFNLPYVRRELAGRRVYVVTLSRWQQGLIVAAGNPKGINGPADLARPDVAVVNREPGSGGRTLLDAGLRAAGIEPWQVRGYARERASHFAVAEAVASGLADAGPGILAAARACDLSFIPLQEERYDLVIPAEHLEAAPVQALLEIAVRPGFRAEVEALGGYDSSEAGRLVAAIAS